MNKDEILQSLRTSGIRITKLRKLIVENIVLNEKPISAPELLHKVKSQVKSANKTTIYRCLDMLSEKGFIKEVYIDPSIVHYELASLPHHHHVTCAKCGMVTEVASSDLEHVVEDVEKSISKSGFVVENHIIEFRGICMSCK